MTPVSPSPDPAALWALVKRWRKEAREQGRLADEANNADETSLMRRHSTAARVLDRRATELASLLPPAAGRAMTCRTCNGLRSVPGPIRVERDYAKDRPGYVAFAASAVLLPCPECSWTGQGAPARPSGEPVGSPVGGVPCPALPDPPW